MYVRGKYLWWLWSNPTPTPSPRPTISPIPTPTNTPLPTRTPFPVPTISPTPVPTRTPTPFPTVTPTPVENFNTVNPDPTNIQNLVFETDLNPFNCSIIKVTDYTSLSNLIFLNCQPDTIYLLFCFLEKDSTYFQNIIQFTGNELPENSLTYFGYMADYTESPFIFMLCEASPHIMSSYHYIETPYNLIQFNNIDTLTSSIYPHPVALNNLDQFVCLKYAVLCIQPYDKQLSYDELSDNTKYPINKITSLSLTA